MKLAPSELQNLLFAMGNVMRARSLELEMSDDLAHASSDLQIAQAKTTAEIQKFKLIVMEGIKADGIPVVKEGDALPQAGDYIIMPASIGCDC